MIKKAFTLIELIFIIILIGILSSVASSYFRDDKLALATYQVLEHIRYTQHLAISDHKFDPKDDYYINYQMGSTGSKKGKYYLSRWQIRFYSYSSGNILYSIYSDRDRMGDIDTSGHIEPARDPLDSNFLMYDTTSAGNDTNGRRNNKVLLSSKYGIKSIAINDDCNPPLTGNPTIASFYFDEKGRPYIEADLSNDTTTAYRYGVSKECILTLIGEDDRQAEITIYPETGYAEITRLE